MKISFHILFLALFTTLQLRAQCPPANPPNAGADLNSAACGSPVNLTAVPIYNVSFTVASAPCVALPTGGTNAFPTTCDDCITGQVPIGFPFNFFGNTYNTAIIQSNGILGFGAFTFTGFSAFAIPSGGNPNNYIAGLYTDIDIRFGGTINYQTIGTAPNRQFVVSYNNVVPYNSASAPPAGMTASFQIILNEDGTFQTRISQYSATWSATTSGVVATQGCENATGTIAIATPGRNSQDFRGIVPGSPSCNLFSPLNCTFLRWQQGATVISNTPNATVSPSANTTYTSYWTCPSGICTDDLVVFVPGPTVTATPSTTIICSSQSARITATGASNYTWSNGANTAVITVSPASTTIYTVTGTTGGCSSTASTTITVNVLTVTCPSNVTVAECNAVVTFATPAATADVCNLVCSQAPLSTILSNFNTNGTAIVSTISNRFNFALDGTGGATGTDISDGGSDMYDGGNELNTNLAALIPYTGGTVLANANFGTGGSYFTQKVDNMFVMAADINNISSFSILGNNGADGSGTANGFTFSFTVGCQTYNAFAKRVNGATDPSINQIFIIPSNPAASHTFSTDTDLSDHTLSGISATTRLYYLLVAGTGGYAYTNAELQNAAQTFITQVGASVSSSGSGLTTVTQSSGLTSGSTFPVGTNTISFRAMSASGASATCSSTIVVTPNAAVTTQPTNRTACAGDILTFNTAVSNGATYQWEYRSSAAGVFGDITNGAGNAPGYLSTVAGATTTTLTLPLMTIANAVSGMQVRLRITGSNGCVVYSNIATITINALPTPSVAGTNVICNGQSTTLTASGGNTYAWSSGQNTAIITVAPTANTTYTVTATNGSGCTATANRAVTVNALPTPNVTGTNTICNGQSTTLTAAGGVSYLWSSGQNTAVITVAPTANTTYTVTATDANGCTATANRAVTVNALPTPNVTGTNVICNGQSTTLTAAGGVSYLWSSGQNTAIITVAPTANTTYTVTATNASGCTATANRAVTVNALPTPNVTGTNVICNGQSTTLTAAGGVSYLWSSGQNTAVITVAPTANTTYTVTATDANGCTATANRAVTVNALPTPAITGTNVICNGQSTTLSATGGTSYIWSNGQTITPITVFPTANTTYTLTATNAAGCTATASRAVTVNALPTPNVTGTNTICNGQSTTLTAAGGVSYLWSSGQNTAVITVAPTANTTYTVTATDANGCTATANRAVAVNALPTPNVTGTNTICNGQSTTLTAAGGVSYLWSSGQNTAVITVAPTANTTYIVTATDANGCTATANRAVTVNALPTPAITGTNVICNGQSTTLSATGGTSYIWSNGQTITPITVFPTANTTYTLTATNAAGCTATASRTVTVNALPTPNVTGTNTICNGQSTTLTAAGGVSYLWSSGQNTAVITVAPTANTTYTVTATDANGCTATANRAVAVNALPTPNVTGTNTICNGQSTTLTAAGGVSYLWSSGQNTAVITVAPTANTTYTVTATNANGCTATANRAVTVNALPTPAITGTNVICNGQSTTLSATGGTSYIWSNGQTITPVTVFPTANTTYTLTATNAAGCTATASRAVTVNAVPTPTVAGSSVICTGQSSVLTAAGGNTYIWSSGQNTAVITVSPTATTIYEVTATDLNGCTATANRFVNVNALPTPTVAGTNVICNGQSTTLTAAGGVSYLWSSGQNTASITVSPTANTTYTVTATNGSGCTATANRAVTVNALPTPNVTGTNTICNGQSTTLTAAAGVSYLWSSGQNTAVITVAPTANTTYTVTATDANGCTATANRTVTVNALPTPTINSSSFVVCDNNSMTITATGGSAYVWSSGQNTAVITVSPTANITYTVTATSAAGCTATTSQAVTVNQSSTVPSIPVMVSTVCPNTNTVLTASGGTSGTGSVIRWYSGANGTGLLGTGASITVSPASNTVYYARREGACNNSSDASVTVTTKTFIYALHGTTTNTYCTDNLGWSHFYVGDEIILSVQGDFSGATTGFPRATIYDNATYRQSPGTNPVPNCIISGLSAEEKFEMERAWDFNLGTGGTPVGTYNVRFYYQPAERTAIETAAANWMATYASCGYSYKYATPLGFYWFKNTAGTYTPPLYDGLHLTGTTGTAGTTNYGQFNGITSFSGGSGAVILVPTVILPITYLQFTGENRGKYNHLDWITVQELDNEYFEVERSIDGMNFFKIGEVAAQRGGAQNQERAYGFDDLNPAIGTNYYRLRQVDTDGSSSLSQIVALDLADNNTSYQFLPNPTESVVNYQVRTLEAEDVDIAVVDMLGRQLSFKTYKSVAGFNSFSVDLSNFAAGSYVVKVLHKNSKAQHVNVIIKTSR